MGRARPDSEAEVGRTARTVTVGKYQLLAVLGRGGMADVFLALARGPMGFNKLVVVKRLRASLAADPSFCVMFMNEARLAARLNHPNVVHTYEVGADHGVYFIAMEYLEGQSLNKIIREAQKREVEFDFAFCARVVSDALAGLRHAHELRDYDGTPLQVIHRDVSPHNIFVTYDGVVKLVDFGIAKAGTAETEAGVLKGKVAYVSPEQAAGEPVDARADVFSMGVVLWELLTLQRLMGDGPAAATLHRLMMLPIPPVSSVRGDVDPELEAITARALEKDPNARFQSAYEMREALEAYIAGSGQSVRSEEIGHHVGEMFVDIRRQILQQIHLHMDGLPAAPIETDVSTLSVDSLDMMPSVDLDEPGTELPMLATAHTSGSGVIANVAPRRTDYGAFYPPPMYAQQVLASAEARESGSKQGIIVWLMAASALALLAVVVMGAREDRAAARVAVAALATATAANAPPSTFPGPDPAAEQALAAPPPTVLDPAPPVAPRPHRGFAPQEHVPTRRHGSRPAVAQAAPPPPDPPAPPTPSAEPETAPPPPPPPQGPGFLTLDTYPWTRVSENGHALGTTPLFHISLPSGPHTLTLENPEKGITQTYSITIKAGETDSHRLDLK